MSHFYGIATGSRRKVTCCATKSSGLNTQAAGWGGAILTDIWRDEHTGHDMFRVTLTPWQGSGGYVVELAYGRLESDLTKLTGEEIKAII